MGLLKDCCTSVETVIMNAQLCTYSVMHYFMVAADVRYVFIFLCEEKDLKLSRYHRQLCLVLPLTNLSASSELSLIGFLPSLLFLKSCFKVNNTVISVLCFFWLICFPVCVKILCQVAILVKSNSLAEV